MYVYTCSMVYTSYWTPQIQRIEEQKLLLLINLMALATTPSVCIISYQEVSALLAAPDSYINLVQVR